MPGLKHTVKFFVKSLLDSLLEILEFGSLYDSHRYPTSSSPFLSGDTFMALASSIRTKHYSLDRNNHTSPSRHHILFVDEQGAKLNTISTLASSLDTVIYHNTDKPPTQAFREWLHQNNIRLFSVNIRPQYPLEQPIPLGIENPSLRGVSPLSYYNLTTSLHLFKKTNRIFLSIRENTNLSERQFCLNELHLLGIRNQSVSPRTYRRLLGSSKFTVCPPGNGLDTHRFWEALYHRSIPIILRKDYLFSDYDFPVLQLDHWSDLCQLSPEDLDSIYSKHEKNLDFCPQLYSNYWSYKLLVCS